MTPWYALFLLGVIVLRLWATPKDRNALSIILVASLVSTLLVAFVTRQIHEAWKLAIPGAVEVVTILAMVLWANGRTALKQVLLLLIAWWAHLQCYLDIKNGTNVIYDNYEKLLGLVAIAQLLACHDALLSIAHSVQRWFNLWASGGRGVSLAGSSSAMVRNPDGASEQKPA